MEGKYVVYWEDHINLCVAEVSSSKSSAKIISKKLNSIQGFHHSYEEIDEFISFLKELRSKKRQKETSENWTNFSPSIKEVRSAKVDFLLNLFVNNDLSKIDFGEYVVSIHTHNEIKIKK